MKAVGLVTEYNPFHNGHLYHLQQAKQLTHADVSIAVMSGNFVQRGEPAILDKWTRANEALANGVDLVIELPVAVAVQPAHLFANGALRLLDTLQVTDLVFGSEHPQWDFNKLVAAQNKFQSQEFTKFNATYATQFNQQLEAQTGISLTESNDILAFGYTQAKLALNSPINLHPILRQGAGYKSADLPTQESFASASAIRLAAINQDPRLNEFVSTQTINDLTNTEYHVSWTRLYPLLRYQLTQAPISYLQQIYQMSEGLEYRLKQAAENADTFIEFMKAAKSKRYTYSRLQRVCLYTLLQITTGEMQRCYNQLYLRVLGFNTVGQQYLHELKKQLKLPLITKMDVDLKQGLLNLDYRAGKLYEQMSHVEQDMRRKPVIK